MLIYEGTKEQFLKDVKEEALVDKIQENLYEKMHFRSGQAEVRSWENSLPRMYFVLEDQDIPDDAGIAIEYNIPRTSKRVDFMVSGYDGNGEGNIVIVELKQWDELTAVPEKDGLVLTYTGNAKREVPHPSYQVATYSMMINNYNRIVQDRDIQLSPCAYLHNYKRKQNDPLDAKQYDVYLKEAPAFTSGQASELHRFIKNRIVKGDHEELVGMIDNSELKPSKSLQECITKVVRGNPEFILLDDQKVVYENILTISRKCMRDQKKRVIIVKGGPGTGKTVVAINLLAQLTNEGQICQYVSKNSAPRKVYIKKLKSELGKDEKKKISIENMFKDPGIFVDAPEDSVGTVLADEAHRLTEKSQRGPMMYGENQIKEIIHAAKCSVFFIDEEQRVTVKDIGSVDEIKQKAEEAGAEVSVMELTSQFRCNGSDGYLAWLDNVLEIRKTANWDLEGIDFDFRVLDTPEELYELVLKRNEETDNRARLLAGYCWEWPKGDRNNQEYHDIKIGDFEISWNLDNGAPYAIEKDSVYQAGCIHTTQGLEFDYVGVIIGDDMRYENGKILTDPDKRASTDASVKGLKSMKKKDPKKAYQIGDEIIKNTYRTLMTRGMKGCYVYCTDKNLADHLRECSNDFIEEK